ncbi:MAG: hypothetical protein ACRDJY_09865 [Thermoleophilaceae bacterium]
MKRIAPVVVLVLLLLPVASHAKGTDVRIWSAPHGTDAGETWTTDVIVSMPGNGRLGGVSPKVIIRKGSVREAFPTTRTGKTGVYRAQVVFPSRGKWSYGVDDGFDRFEPGAGRVHRFPRVMIAAGQPELAKAPKPISGDISMEMEAEQPAPRGQLPPERYVVPGSKDDESDGDGGSAMFPALAFLLAAAVAGPVWLRRRRNNKRAA